MLYQVVTENGGFAGTAAVFTVDGDREVSHWIARHAWGRGVATAALRGSSRASRCGRCYARAAAHNAAAIAVLPRLGFTEVSRGARSPRARPRGRRDRFALPASLDGA